MHQHYGHINRKGWTGGPWSEEPDKVEFQNPGPCIVIREANGTLSGYAAVGRDNPLHGKHLNQTGVFPCFGCMPDKHFGCTPKGAILVYGGLKFAGSTQPSVMLGRGINAVSFDDRDLWWFGFETGINDDFIPSCGLTCSKLMVYRDMNWMIQKTSNLSADLAKLGRFSEAA